MQTFLAYPDFNESARVLDDKRLGKQRVECLQILNVLAIGPYQKKLTVPQQGPYGVWQSCSIQEYEKATAKTNPQQPFGFVYRRTPWYNHPAVKMWRGFERCLYHRYLAEIVGEWLHRGFKDTCYGKARLAMHSRDDWSTQTLDSPTWLGNPAFHAAHRSNLLRKDPNHYSQFGWTEPHNLPYIWPV